MSKLRAEIQQAKPFESLAEELWLNLARTAAVISHEVEQRLRPFGLSPTQYNVLRILRGAGGAGLMQHEVGSRLVANVPDVPRILARMEKVGWIKRARGLRDRRVRRVTLAEAGLKLVDGLDEVVERMHTDLFRDMESGAMRSLCDLLVLARSGSTSAHFD